MVKRLVLGSHSPRRKEILSFFRLPFEEAVSSFVETHQPFCEDPAGYASAFSKGKALALVDKYPDAVILTADTIVYKEGKLFNKPASEEDAFEMLSSLQGGWHSVYTAVTARKNALETTSWAETRVLFHPLSTGQIQLYIKAIPTQDKAGGYAIQQAGSLIVKRIEGCFYNVMGLPLTATSEVLKKMGIDLWHFLT